MIGSARILIPIFVSFLISNSAIPKSLIIADKKKQKTIVYDLCFTPGGSALAAANETSLEFYDSSTGDVIRSFPVGHNKDIIALDISSDSSLIATGSKDSTVIIWSVEKGNILKRLRFNNGVITSVRFSDNNDKLYITGTKGRLILYNITSDAVIFDRKVHQGLITAMDICHSTDLIVTAGSEGSILLFNATSGELITELYRDAGWIRDIAFSNDGSRIIAGGDKGILFSWKATFPGEYKLLAKERKSVKWIYGVDIQKEPNLYVYCGMNRKFYANIKASSYMFRCGVFVFKVKIKPGNNNNIILAAATNGKGIIIKNVSDMKTIN